MWPAGCSLPIFGLAGNGTSRKTGKQTPSLTVVYTLPPPPPKMKAAPETNCTQLSESWALASLGKPIPVHTWGNPGQLPLLREFLHIPVNVQILTPWPQTALMPAAICAPDPGG